ncbi:MAG: ribonuclease PH [Actinomycetaceae bacterium]|nr:ribonuclease PH [Actinomycetaceae bacterium]
MSGLIRRSDRGEDEKREVTIKRHWLDTGEGNVLVNFGNTTVLCVASFVEGVPKWRKGSGKGWVTAEYSMLPRATQDRMQRESVRGKIGGRTHEISRLIGRSLRSIVDLDALGENTISLDCDVLQADGGTRTASITGAFVALADAVNWAVSKNIISPHRKPIISDTVSAISVGILSGQAVLDLPYVEDSMADTDMNVVMTGKGSLVEVQGTAEGEVFTRQELNTLLDLAEKGCMELAQLQRDVLFSSSPIDSRIIAK